MKLKVQKFYTSQGFTYLAKEADVIPYLKMEFVTLDLPNEVIPAVRAQKTGHITLYVLVLLSFSPEKGGVEPADFESKGNDGKWLDEIPLNERGGAIEVMTPKGLVTTQI